MALRSKQSYFVKALALLIQFAALRGWELTLGEGYVGDSVDKAGEDTPHIRHGNHFTRLAQDLNLFVDGRWIENLSPEWIELGSFWKSLGGGCAWGGDWGDYNHFSMEHEGIK